MGPEEKMERALNSASKRKRGRAFNPVHVWGDELRAEIPKEWHDAVHLHLNPFYGKPTDQFHIRRPETKGRARIAVKALEHLLTTKKRNSSEALAVVEMRQRRLDEWLKEHPAPGLPGNQVPLGRERRLSCLEEHDGELVVMMGSFETAQEIDFSEEPCQNIKIIEEPVESAQKALPGAFAGAPMSKHMVRAEEIVTAMLETEDLEKVARKFNMTRRTINNLKRDPRFQALYHERRQEYLAMGVAYLQRRFAEINKGLVEMFFDPEVSPAVRAHVGLELTKRVQAQIDQEAQDARDLERLERERSKIKEEWGV